MLTFMLLAILAKIHHNKGLKFVLQSLVSPADSGKSHCSCSNRDFPLKYFFIDIMAFFLGAGLNIEVTPPPLSDLICFWYYI